MKPLPPEIASWITSAKDVATLFAAVIGTYVAIAGLSAWKRQLSGKTNYELARRLLRAAYKFRVAISVVRHPVVTSGEAEEAQKEIADELGTLDINPAGKRTYAIYKVRGKEINTALIELQAESFEAEISWGATAKSKIAELGKLIVPLRIAVEDYVQAQAGNGMPRTYSASEVHETLFDTLDPINPDKFTQRVNIALEAIEVFLRPHLGPK